MSGELLLQVGRIRRAWPLLADRLAGVRESRPATAPTAATLAARGRLLTAERADRWRLTRDRTVPTGSTEAPIAVDVADARIEVDRVVCEVAVELHRVAWGEPLQTYATRVDTRVPAALDVITSAGRRVRHRPLLLEAAARLEGVASLAEQVGRLTVEQIPIRGRGCPACGSQSLRVRRESPTGREWVVECRRPQCVCRSGWCGCRVDTVRPPEAMGQRHVWGRDEWATLGELIGADIELLAGSSCAS